MGRFNKCLIKTGCFLIYVYQLLIKPFLPLSCRFYPSCSEYTFNALKTHGLIKGMLLSFCRLIKCNPFFKGGVDLVPKLQKEES